jgi:hypothetical protein
MKGVKYAPPELEILLKHELEKTGEYTAVLRIQIFRTATVRCWSTLSNWTAEPLTHTTAWSAIQPQPESWGA